MANCQTEQYGFSTALTVNSIGRLEHYCQSRILIDEVATVVDGSMTDWKRNAVFGIMRFRVNRESLNPFKKRDSNKTGKSR